jgi:hypothetical protein
VRGGGFGSGSAFFALPGARGRFAIGVVFVSRAPGIASRMAFSVPNGPWISSWPNSFDWVESTRNQPTSAWRTSNRSSALR